MIDIVIFDDKKNITTLISSEPKEKATDRILKIVKYFGLRVLTVDQIQLQRFANIIYKNNLCQYKVKNGSATMTYTTSDLKDLIIRVQKLTNMYAVLTSETDYDNEQEEKELNAYMLDSFITDLNSITRPFNAIK